MIDWFDWKKHDPSQQVTNIIIRLIWIFETFCKISVLLDFIKKYLFDYCTCMLTYSDENSLTFSLQILILHHHHDYAASHVYMLLFLTNTTLFENYYFILFFAHFVNSSFLFTHTQSLSTVILLPKHQWFDTLRVLEMLSLSLSDYPLRVIHSAPASGRTVAWLANQAILVYWQCLINAITSIATWDHSVIPSDCRPLYSNLCPTWSHMTVIHQ